MLKSLWELTKQVLGLTKDTEKNKAAIAELQEQVEELTAAMQRLAFELKRTQENEAHEREQMALRLENALLRFERRLPPKDKKSSEDD